MTRSFSLACGVAVFVAACGTGEGLDGTLPASDELVARRGFVRVDGLGFTLDGAPFYFQGTNFYDIGLLRNRREDEVYRAFTTFSSHGIKVVRLWGFSCAGALSDGVPMIRSVTRDSTEYDETALQRLDVALDAARAANVKVILTLVNFEPENCGMEFWVRQVIGSEDKALFYTDPDVRTAFKRHVSTLLSRVNTRRAQNGERVMYKDDPTIMSVELANEPHTVDFYEISRGLAPGELANGWLSDMSEYVRREDPNHLISTGEEGYKTSHTTGDQRFLNQWIHNGSKGEDFARNTALPKVDFATVHIYPDNWNISSSDMAWVDEYLVRDRAQIAHGLGKPIILEESGFDDSTRFSAFDYHNSPERYLRKMFQFANAAGYAGTMVWQALPPGAAEDHGYNFDTNMPQFRAVADQARCMNSLNQGQRDCAAIDASADGTCTDIPPDDRFTCSEQASWRKCDESFMVGFCNASCGHCP